jgi:hypothetical protein
MTRAFIVLVLCVLWARVALAETTWGLRWRAPEECISASELSQAVEERLGHAVFRPDPKMRIDGNVKRADAAPRWRAHLTIVDAGGNVSGSREIDADDASCRALDAKLALAITLMIQPGAPERQERTSDAPLAKPNGTLVHIDADNTHARLYRMGGTAIGVVNGQSAMLIGYTDECSAPCDQVILRPRDYFYVAGEGIMPSSQFTLENAPAAVDLKVKTGSPGLWFTGIMLGSLGACGLLTGGLLYGISAGSSSSGMGGLATASLFTALGGALLLAIGIPLWLGNSTDVEVVPHVAPVVAQDQLVRAR